MSNRSSINLASRRGRLTAPKTGCKRLLMRGPVLWFLSSLSSDPSAKDVPPHGGGGGEPLNPGNLAVYSLVNFKKMAFMVIRRRNS